MKFFIMLFFITSFAQARTFKARIDHIDRATSPTEHDLMLFSDGSVGVLRSSHKSLTSFQTPSDDMKIILDAHHNVISVTPLTTKEKSLDEEEIVSPQEENFLSIDPTHLKRIQDARSIFSNMRRDYQDESQCYNRAHIWAYEENRRNGTSLQKIFIFFTTRYIRNYNYYWWFHAIPAIYVGSDLITLDRRYTNGPLGLQTWSNIFVQSHRTCPIISRYSQYTNNQSTEDCYIHPSSMYFWQPQDLATYEQTGRQKTSFISSEVNAAYGEAF
jgi:hypothetical protein